MPKTFRYLARQYQQTGESGLPIVTFVAKATDISQWAGVPRKAEEVGRGTYTGFQRALDEERTEQIKDFFDDPKNISPTAIVVAFREGTCTVEPLAAELATQLHSGQEPGELVWISFELEDMGSRTLQQLLEEFLDSARRRVAGEDQSNPDDTESRPPESVEPGSENEFVVHDSHLKAFVKWLEEALAAVRDGRALPGGVSENEVQGTLEAMLSPAMLVDGQHRVFGGQMHGEATSFCVCALLNAPWEEQVFQFVVINQQSQGIEGSFLSAIVSSSLTQAEVRDLETRLKSAGVNVLVAELMDRVSNDGTSPFYRMVKFGVVGETGWLPYTGLKQLALRWWSIGGSDFDRVVGPACSGTSRQEKIADWRNRRWWDYFSAFWGAMRARYEPTPQGEIALWSDRNSQLLRVVTLQTMQGLFLHWMKYSQRTFNSNIDAFKADVGSWAQCFPHAFFREPWNGATLPKDRAKLKDALDRLVENPEFKFRNSRLFQDRSSS
jgi:hypothetical protein